MSRDPASPSDAQLLRQYVRGRDDAAFGRVVGRHMRAVRHVAYRYTHHRQAAEDVAQAAFLVMAQRPRQALRSAKWKRSALPWLAKVARYAAANWRRAEERRHRHETRAAAHEPAHYDPTAGVELAEAVRSALSCLPRRDRRIVEWRHLSQMPWDEVARQAGTTPEAARKAGALSQLRVVLEKRGVTAGGAAVLAGLRALTLPAQSSAATLPAVLSPVQIAEGVLTMLKAQTTAVTIAALLASAGLVTTAAAMLQDEPPASAPQAAGRPGLSGTLSDGTVVNLYAVGDQAGNWWTPDGDEPVTIGHSGALTKLGEGQIGIAAAVRVERRDGSSVSEVSFDTPATLIGQRVIGGNVGVLVGFPAEPGDKALWLNVLVPVGEPIELGRISTRFAAQASLEEAGVRVRSSPLGRYRPQGHQSETTFATLYFEGRTAGNRLHAALAMDDGTTRPGAVAVSGVGDVATYTVHFGDVDPAAAEELIVSLQPLEMARFGSLAQRPGATAKPWVQVLNHESTAGFVRSHAMFRGRVGDLEKRLSEIIDKDDEDPENFSIEGVPLIDVVTDLGRRGVVIAIDFNGLERAGVLNKPIHVELTGDLTVEQALRRIGDAAGDKVEIVIDRPAHRVSVRARPPTSGDNGDD